jgi:glycosyltransferase involved in cell wall biosynthesis
VSTLNFWLVTVGEPLPTDPGDPRLHRSGMVAEELTSRGHDVTWWTSSFDHFNRVQRAPGYYRLDRSRGRLGLVVLPGPGYRRDASLARFVDHTLVAARFRHVASRARAPSLIVAALPTLELCEASRRLAAGFGAPYLVDVRDLWPDIFERSLPRVLRPLSAPVIWPYRKLARAVCRQASGIVAITEPFLNWGLDYAGRPAGPSDLSVPFGYPAPDLAAPNPEAEAFWDRMGIGHNTPAVIFLGSFSDQFEFDHVFRAAARVAVRYPKVRFVLCGKGALAGSLRSRATATPNVVVTPWIGRGQIRALLARSVLGLAPYRPHFDFLQSIPNKIPEYLSAGLPIAASLADSEVSRLLQRYRVGHAYQMDDGQRLAAIVMASVEAAEAEVVERRRRCVDLFQQCFRADVVYGRYADHLERVAVRR